MKNLNENWIKENLKNECKIEKLNGEIIKCSKTYRDVFNGEPFYEDWTINSACDVIKSYCNDETLILISKYYDDIIGFLISINGVPESQLEYAEFKENIKFIEEIGVLSQYRNNGLASEMVRNLLVNYLNPSDQYLGYRTNAMRYFDYYGESFESAAMRIQREDKIKRLNGESIIIPKFNDSEKQKFINKYIELINNNPTLDVSNSNALFRDIFGEIKFSQIDGNYSFQIDPTGEGNDRIFPVIELKKVKK